jgi:tetratricopeptide (TPR) repeat protein
MQPSEPAPSNRPTAAAGAAALALPLLALVAAFVGGATQPWSMAIVLGGFSLLLVVRPPRFSLGPTLNIIALLFVALAAASFLPARWFFEPHWRLALSKDFGVQLASTATAQPWITLHSLVLLVAGLSWSYYVATFEATLREIRLAARTYAAGIIALAALCLFLRSRGTALPFWHNELGFGPFPNRNQTGDLFGISTVVVLGCMQDDFRRGHKRWLLWVPGLGVLVAALILAYSRAGILILIVGVTAWLVRLAFRKWSGGGIAIAVSAMLVLLAGLLIFGGETIERFRPQIGSSGFSSDFRWLTFRDALAMIQASPWCGIGLGNFESVFALFRDASRSAQRSLHPESDWVWVAAEMGWPAVVLILAAAILFVRRALPLREGTNQRLRYAALVGGILFLIHGFVDVSAHRLGSLLAGTLLLGLAQFRPFAAIPRRWPPFFFRFAGVILALVSLTWFFGWRRGLPVPGPLGVDNAKKAAVIANRGHRYGDAIQLLDRALDWAPLDWQLYFLRATTRVALRENPAEALADFRRARFLEPNAYQVPFEEGKAWLGWQPTLAITAWREALQRYGAKEAGIYTLMLADAANRDSTVHDALREFAIRRPSLTIDYLDTATPPQFEAVVRQLLTDDPQLRGFSSEQKKRLFELWSERGPIDELLRNVQTDPEWIEFAWPGVVRYHAGRQEFKQAWQLVRQHAPPPALPKETRGASISQLEQELYASPGDFAAGYRLYRAQIEAGNTDDALATIRHFTSRPDAPAYFYYLEAQAWAAKENWERACQSWRSYEATRQKP